MRSSLICQFQRNHSKYHKRSLRPEHSEVSAFSLKDGCPGFINERRMSDLSTNLVRNGSSKQTRQLELKLLESSPLQRRRKTDFSEVRLKEQTVHPDNSRPAMTTLLLISLLLRHCTWGTTGWLQLQRSVHEHSFRGFRHLAMNV